MASIRKRGGKYFVEIRRKGYPPQRSTFGTNAAAKAWARRTETSMDEGTWFNPEADNPSIKNIMDYLIYSFERFGLEVASPKTYQINKISEYFDGIRYNDLSVDDILNFAAHRRQTVKASTLQKDVYYLSQAVNNASALGIINVQKNVVDIAIKELASKKIIMGSVWRDRRLEPGEYERLEGHATRPAWAMLAIDFALMSAMRQGEVHTVLSKIASEDWSDIDLKKKIIRVWRKDKKAEKGKSLHKVPILPGMNQVIEQARDKFAAYRAKQKRHTKRALFPKKAKSVSFRFATITDKAGINNLWYHDLRHEAISRMVECGMPLEKVRLMSGHSSLDQLTRYLHLRAEDFNAAPAYDYAPLYIAA